jgi:hypothetical protein
MFHRHKWAEIARTYAPPAPKWKGDNIIEPTLEKLMLGVTTIVWECSVCHKIRKEELLGEQV